MKYLPIDSQLFIENRKRFTKQLKPKSLAVFNSNDIMPTNADGTLPFRQNNDIFYLSGVDQEESILVIFPDVQNNDFKEVLFLKETSAEIAIWEGAKLTKEQAFEVSGIKTVFWLSQFEMVFNKMMAEADSVYLNANEHLRAAIEVETRDARFTKLMKERYPLHNYKRSAPILHRLRAIKRDEEVVQIQTACDITEKGLRRVLEICKPGIMEYELEGELTGLFLKNRSRGHAYEPIIASGFDACVLHYIDNEKACKDGDMLLMDFGAEYANYASDLTRTIPVNGRFTKRQRDVYDAVLRVFRQASELLEPGTILDDYRNPPEGAQGLLYHEEVGKMMESELIGLGLLDKTDVKNQDPTNPLYKKYFMHGTSHYLGLDVHDVGLWNCPMEAGMVFTCEPGIYIREENMGVRLENDILITSDGPKDLMANIPIEAEEIEELMNA
jgi:Xaa-Pro aminopeptidase